MAFVSLRLLEAFRLQTRSGLPLRRTHVFLIDELRVLITRYELVHVLLSGGRATGCWPALAMTQSTLYSSDCCPLVHQPLEYGYFSCAKVCVSWSATRISNASPDSQGHEILVIFKVFGKIPDYTGNATCPTRQWPYLLLMKPGFAKDCMQTCDLSPQEHCYARIGAHCLPIIECKMSPHSRHQKAVLHSSTTCEAVS